MTLVYQADRGAFEVHNLTATCERCGHRGRCVQMGFICSDTSDTLESGHQGHTHHFCLSCFQCFAMCVINGRRYDG